jgi:hypothetical protein
VSDDPKDKATGWIYLLVDWKNCSAMDEVDRVANRVSLAALTGLLGGVSLATYKGSSIPRTSLSMAASFAIVGTACFGLERLSNVVMRQVNVENSDNKHEQMALYASHAIGGMVGGGITAAIFQQRPIPGMILCTPLMLGIALAELTFKAAREERLQEMLAKSQGSSVEHDQGSS